MSEQDGREGDLPAFAILDENWKEVALAKLPVPEAVFGLSLRGLQGTDSGLKSLVGQKQLRTFDIINSQVTAAGRKKPRNAVSPVDWFRSDP